MSFLFRISLNKVAVHYFIPTKVQFSIDIYQFLQENTSIDTNRTLSVIFKKSYALFL